MNPASSSRSDTAGPDAEPGRQLAMRIAEMLSSDPVRQWRLADLEEECHLSASQIGRLFNAHFGMPPMRYLAQVRARRLARLLVETDLPVSAAMAAVGWRSRAHATRQFTRITGVSPSAYRAGARRRTS